MRRAPCRPISSVGASNRARDDAKLALPGGAGRQRQRPADEDGRALVDPLEPGFGERDSLDRRPAGVAGAAPADLDFAANPLVDEGERLGPRERAARAQRGRALEAVVPSRRIARGQREVELHGPPALDRLVAAPREAVAGAQPGA